MGFASILYSLEMGAVVVLGAVFFSVVCIFAVRRFRSPEVLKENNEFAGITYPVVGLIYGVFLAFMIVIAWQEYSDAEQFVVLEVTHLSELWRDSEVFDDPHRSTIQTSLMAYVQAVKDKEWESMGKRCDADHTAGKAYEALWESYYRYEPHGERQKAFYSTSVNQLNDVGRYRRQRIMCSKSELPVIMWVFVIAGGVITMGLHLLLGIRSIWAQVLISGIIAALISFSIFLVFSLQRPFTGDMSIPNTHYEDLLKSFKHRAARGPVELG